MAEQDGVDNIRNQVDALATDLENMMSDNVFFSSRSCIFRVPDVLSRHNPKAYAPNAFSIGPFHYNKQNLQATRKIKLKYLNDLISRFANTNRQTKLRDLMATISKVRDEAREFYGGSIDMSMDEFLKVLILDGCFLIELFRRIGCENLRREDDPLIGVKCMCTILNQDLILLENQIPWLVLDRLFEMTTTQEDKFSLKTLVAVFFYGTFRRGVEIYREEEPISLFSNKREIKHILDLLRNSMILPSSITKQERSFNCLTEWQQIPSATSLQEAGIKFKKATSTAASNFLDIKFKDGVLEIPSLFIQDSTESLFRNLICLEQCLPHCEEVITSYIMLLDNLINTSKDMEILCKSEIIDNWLDIEDATLLFNRLLNDTAIPHFYYLNLTMEVNKYCRRRWPRYRTVLVHDYFKHPWALISVVVAAILLILTFLQTLFTIIK